MFKLDGSLGQVIESRQFNDMPLNDRSALGLLSLSDGVIIWTRFVGADGGQIAWEISEDENFANVTQRGYANSDAGNDFCVKVDVRGIAADRRYFYRFLAGSEASLTGQTRTAPLGSAQSLSIALVSCSNYAFGYFHACLLYTSPSPRD